MDEGKNDFLNSKNGREQLDIKQYVTNICKKYKTNDPYMLAENYSSIKIIKEPLGEEIRGFYHYFKNNRLIYINTQFPSYIQRVVCAHELGHALMHTKINIVLTKKHTYISKNIFERQANMFAAELLLPDNLLRGYTDYTLEQIAAMENLPIEIVYLKKQYLY